MPSVRANMVCLFMEIWIRKFFWWWYFIFLIQGQMACTEGRDSHEKVTFVLKIFVNADGQAWSGLGPK